MKNLTWQNPEQLFVAQVLINKVKSKCCGIKGKMEKQKKMRQVLRIIPQNKLKQFKEFSVSDTDSIYFVQNYYTNNDIAEEGFVKRDKGTFCRIGRWKFYAKDGRCIMVSYEDKKYSKGIIIEEGFLHDHFDYFY